MSGNNYQYELGYTSLTEAQHQIYKRVMRRTRPSPIDFLGEPKMEVQAYLTSKTPLGCTWAVANLLAYSSE